MTFDWRAVIPHGPTMPAAHKELLDMYCRDNPDKAEIFCRVLAQAVMNGPNENTRAGVEWVISELQSYMGGLPQDAADEGNFL
jgi:hypothetical protein